MSQTKKFLSIIQIAALSAMFFPFSSSIATQETTTAQISEKQQTLADDNKAVDGEIIIKYKKSRLDLRKTDGRRKVQTLEEEKRVENIDKLEKHNMQLVRAQEDTEKTLEELRDDPNVQYAEPNYKRKPSAITTNDSLFSTQWSLSKMNVPLAWEHELESGSEIIVADIDTGAIYDHEDLAANMWDGSAGCKDYTGAAISGGCPHHGWDYKDNDNDPYDSSWADSDTSERIDGHGTATSGIIGAVSNNTLGLSSTSYRNNIKIMPVRFGLDTYSELEAISFAQENGAKVINASFGGTEYSQIEKDFIDSFNGVFVAAAGNDGANIDTTPTYPASYTSSNLISVAASDSNDALASFSSYGATSVDVAAPGVSVRTTYNSSTSSYAYASGTSFAAPAVSSLAAFLFSQSPELTVSENVTLIKNYGQTLPNSEDAAKLATGKRIDAHASIAQIIPEDTIAPSLPSGLSVE